MMRANLNVMFYKEEKFRDTPLGKFPEDWKIVRLEDIVKEVDLRAKDVKKSDIKRLPVLSLTKDFGLIPQEQRFHKRIAKGDTSNYKVVKEGWLVYNPFVIWEGAICVLKDSEIGLVSPVYLVWKPIANLDYRFLDYMLTTKRLLNTYLKFATGAVQRRRSLKKKDFLKISVPLPPYQEQIAITHVLSTVDEAIQKTDEIIEKIRRLKKGLMRELLTKGIGHNEFKEDTEIGRVPKEWKIVKLGSVLELCQYGLSIKMSDRGKYPIVRMDEIKNGYVTPKITKRVNLDYETFRNFKLEKGDILFNRTNSYEIVGKTGIFLLDGDYVFASYLIRLRVKRNMIDPHFLTFYLIFSHSKLRRLATRGVQQANINAASLKRFKIPLPPLNEQKEIVKILTTLDKRLEVERKRKEKLERIKKALMDLLLTGKIRIKVKENA